MFTSGKILPHTTLIKKIVQEKKSTRLRIELESVDGANGSSTETIFMIKQIDVCTGSWTAGTEEHEPFSNLYKRTHSLSVDGLGETPQSLASSG